MNHCRYRRCRGCSFEKSLQNPAGSAVDSNVAAVDLAAAVGVAAAADYGKRSWSIPFVRPFHSDRARCDDGGDCSVRWSNNKISTAPVFGRAALIHYCISLPTTIPPFVVLFHRTLPRRFSKR